MTDKSKPSPGVVDAAVERMREARSSREAIEAECMTPLPQSAVSSRQQAGATLSYVQQHYVIRRLCEVFGPLGFDVETVSCELVCQPYEVTNERSQKTTWRVGYRAKVQITVWSLDGRGTIKEGTGVGQGIDKDLILAHESGAKEAETDALKRAARLLGDSFGLALYDKQQEHVETLAQSVIRLVREGDISTAKRVAKQHWRGLNAQQRKDVTEAIQTAEKAAQEAASSARQQRAESEDEHLTEALSEAVEQGGERDGEAA